MISNLYSTLALAGILREAGHDVAFAAPKNCREDIAHAGFAFRQIAAPVLGFGTGHLPRPGLWRTPGLRAARAEAAAHEILKDGITEILSDTEPDLVLADVEHHSGIIQARAKGLKVATLSFMYFTPPGPMAPPITRTIVPGQGFWGTRIRIAIAWQRFWLRKRIALARSRWRGWGADMPSAHRHLAGKLGVDLSSCTTDSLVQIPWSYTLPNLLLLAQSVDFRTKPATHQTFLGPMVHRNRRPGPSGDRSGAFFDDDPSKKRIYVAFGSIRVPPASFMASLLAVARDRPDWAFLIASSAPEPTDPLPANVSVVRWAPQLEALSHADCAIFHGGAGTLNECLAHGTPMIIYPDALDGKGNAARVVYHGLGAMGSYKDRKDEIEGTIETVLNSDDMTRRLRAIQDSVNSPDAKARTVAAVERIIKA